MQISRLIILLVLRLKSFSSKLTFKKEKKKKERESIEESYIFFTRHKSLKSEEQNHQ